MGVSLITYLDLLARESCKFFYPFGVSRRVLLKVVLFGQEIVHEHVWMCRV